MARSSILKSIEALIIVPVLARCLATNLCTCPFCAGRCALFFADHVSAIRRRLGARRLEQLPRRLGPLRTCRRAEIAQKYVQACAWRFCNFHGVLWPARRVQMHCNTYVSCVACVTRASFVLEAVTSTPAPCLTHSHDCPSTAVFLLFLLSAILLYAAVCSFGTAQASPSSTPYALFRPECG